MNKTRLSPNYEGNVTRVHKLLCGKLCIAFIEFNMHIEKNRTGIGGCMTTVVIANNCTITHYVRFIGGLWLEHKEVS